MEGMTSVSYRDNCEGSTEWVLKVVGSDPGLALPPRLAALSLHRCLGKAPWAFPAEPERKHFPSCWSALPA